jgi:hypothetical protein
MTARKLLSTKTERAEQGCEHVSHRIQVYVGPQESIKKRASREISTPISKMLKNVGVPYGSRTRVAAVKEKGPIVIQRNFAAWVALYRT